MVVILIIEGQTGGNRYSNKGGGSNYICLPNDPDNGKPYSYANDVLSGAEYEVGGSRKPSGLANLHNKDVPCAVCRRRGKSSVLMIPGTRYFIQINKINSNKMLISYPERVFHDMAVVYFGEKTTTNIINLAYALTIITGNILMMVNLVNYCSRLEF
jgi:hypothetical protein